MVIDTAIINYGDELRVSADSEVMELRRWVSEERDFKRFSINPDEFRELIELAKLVGWEL